MLVLCDHLKMAIGFVLFAIFSVVLINNNGASALGQFEIGPTNNRSSRTCNIYNGTWVYDSTYPLYDSSTCPFSGEGFDCLENGRPDKEYLKYKWTPFDCQLPRFDGRDFLERYRGKKVMFVGDSLSHNMWVSLACLLQSAVPSSRYTMAQNGSITTIYFPEFEASIMWDKNGLLVDLMKVGKSKVLKLGSITSGKNWVNVDLLIFNSYHWWTHTGDMQAWDYIDVGHHLVRDMDHMQAYSVAMETWGNWVDTNIDPSKTKVYFQGIAVSHAGEEWAPYLKGCIGEMGPLNWSTRPAPTVPERIIKDVIVNMKSEVKLIDITLLTQLRIDGHPSIYNDRGSSFHDCSHWCVAGVPDTWNILLYATLLHDEYKIAPSPSPENQRMDVGSTMAISSSLSLSFLFSLIFLFHW